MEGVSLTSQEFSMPLDEETPDQDLEEILVNGEAPVRNRESIARWLRQFPGRYRNEGELWRSGGSVSKISGVTDCRSVGPGPGAICLISLQAPPFDTNVNPGAFLLGIDLENPLVRYMTVDDKGSSVGAVAPLRGISVEFRTPCQAPAVRRCICTTRLVAKPGAEAIRLLVEIEMDGATRSRFDVSLVRSQ